MRIRIETDACLLLLESVRRRRYRLIASPVHTEEINAIEELEERRQLLDMLLMIGQPAKCDLGQVRERAAEFHIQKFGLSDSAHAAFAEFTADVFVTCDDRLIKRCKRVGLGIPVFNPAEFVLKENLR